MAMGKSEENEIERRKPTETSSGDSFDHFDVVLVTQRISTP
jgi:hypothetical protein